MSVNVNHLHGTRLFLSIHTTLNPDKVPVREVERASNRSWSGTSLATTSQDGNMGGLISVYFAASQNLGPSKSPMFF